MALVTSARTSLADFDVIFDTGEKTDGTVEAVFLGDLKDAER